MSYFSPLAQLQFYVCYVPNTLFLSDSCNCYDFTRLYVHYLTIYVSRFRFPIECNVVPCTYIYLVFSLYSQWL
eukprot:c20941_g1_i1 orf=336-554(+)